MAVTLEEMIIEIDLNTSDFDRRLSKIEGSFGGLGKIIKNVGAGLLAVFAGRKIIDGIKAISKAVDEQVQAETRLANIAKTVTNATDEQIEALKELASEQQKVTTIGDDVTIALQSQLASFGLTADEVGRLTAASQDLAVATFGVNVSQDQAIQTANLLGKSYSGLPGSLSRVGVLLNEQQSELLKTGNSTTKVNALIEIIAQNYGGLAEAQAKTAQGMKVQLGNAFSDLQEIVGFALLPTLERFLAFMIESLPKIESLTETLSDGVVAGLDGIAIAFENSQTLIDKYVTENKGFLDELSISFENGFNKILGILDIYVAFYEKNLIPLIQIFSESVKKFLPPVLKQFNKTFGTIFKLSVDLFNQFAKTILPIAQVFWDVAKKYLPQVVSIFSTTFSIILKLVESVGNLFLGVLLPAILDLFKSANKNVPAIGKIFSTVFGAMIKTLEVAAWIIEIVADGILKMTKTIAGQQRALLGFNDTIESTSDSVEKYTGKMKNSVTESHNVVAQARNEERQRKLLEDAINADSDAMGGLGDSIEETSGKAEDARKNTISGLQTLGDNVVRAFENVFQKQETAQLSNLDSLIENQTRASDKIIQQFMREKDAAIQIFDEQKTARIEGIQEQIDAINNLTDREDEEERVLDVERRKRELRNQISEEQDAEKRAKIQEDLNDTISDEERRQEILSRKNKIDALREEIELVNEQGDEEREILTSQFDEKIALKEQERDNNVKFLEIERSSLEAHYDQLLQADRIQATAREFIINQSQKDIVDLLDSFAPGWFDAGISFGEQLLTGIEANESEIRRKVRELTDLVGSGSAGGGSDSSTSGSVSQSNTFNITSTSAFDIVKQVQRMNNNLALQLG